MFTDAYLQVVKTSTAQEISIIYEFERIQSHREGCHTEHIQFRSAANVHAMNLSYSDQGSSFTVKFSTTSKVTITVLYAATIMFGIAGNSIAIYFAIMKKAGNRVTNMLILNMAIADMLITIFAMPYSIIFLQVGLKWIGGILGQITCKIVLFSYQVSIPASIFTVMAVSLDRFFAVLYPAKVRALRKVKMTTLAIWVSSAVYAVPFIFAHDIQQQNGIYYCIRYFPPFDNEISSQIYYLITKYLTYQRLNCVLTNDERKERKGSLFKCLVVLALKH
ncbi:neuropeptide SIFamide receptor-like [Montipora foliosa]|uniref:neuropeptide SIFamide receptor-like n=1 Tax=Montipora foliosa TaxID=591990 RepID=UPI0035F1BE9C